MAELRLHCCPSFEAGAEAFSRDGGGVSPDPTRMEGSMRMILRQLLPSGAETVCSMSCSVASPSSWNRRPKTAEALSQDRSPRHLHGNQVNGSGRGRSAARATAWKPGESMQGITRQAQACAEHYATA